MSPFEWKITQPNKGQPQVLENNQTFHNCVWHNMGSLMQQGSDIAPHLVAVKDSKWLLVTVQDLQWLLVAVQDLQWLLVTVQDLQWLLVTVQESQ
uniref:Uncharacterized protein n=1 Tax=Timema bartmani TaxID=61472 RepID=A0A7R9EYL6_9NEOP|nr:unnamed protein product [Timema bartmani]